MATTVTLNGSNYSIPASGDDDWAGTSKVDGYLVALATGVLPKSGGSFTLTAEVDFGATYGVKSAYVKSRATNPASAGIVRLGNAESVKWRNAANSADLDLTVDSSNVLNYNGAPIVTLALGAGNTALVMNAGGTAYSWASIVNANISASAAIAYSKLNLATSILNADVNATAAIALSKLAATTASRALVSDASGFVSASAVTATELGYLSGITSAVQTQLNTGAANLSTHAALTAAHGISGAVVGTTDTQELSAKTLTSPVINTGVSGTAIKDEDNMVSDSATHLATQQSIKAYVDTQISSVSSSGSTTSAKTADYIVTDIDNIRTLLVTTGVSNVTITLPTAAANSYRMISVKKVDSGAGTVIIDGEGAETVDGATTYVLNAQYDEATVQCDASAWHLLDRSRLATTSTPGLLFSEQSCAAYSAADQTGIASGVATKIAFGTEEYDANGIYDSVTNYRITPPAGKYLITASARVDSSSANTTTSAGLIVYKNGAVWKRLAQIVSETGAIDAFPWGGCAVVEGNGTDYFEIYANVTTSTSTWNILSGQSFTYFTCTRIA